MEKINTIDIEIDSIKVNKFEKFKNIYRNFILK
jgi:hypothetical protein